MYLLNTNKTLQRIHTLMLFLFQTMNIILFCLDLSQKIMILFFVLNSCKVGIQFMILAALTLRSNEIYYKTIKF